MNKITFMGVELEEQGPSDLIVKALGKSIKLMDLETFIDTTGFEKDPIMNDYFWQIMVTKQRTHLSAMLLQCLGYEGEFRVQQQHFKRFLKSNNIHPLELTSSDPDIKNYPTIQDEMKLLKPNVISNRKWLIVEPREFKKVIMKLNTKHGDRIREYYLCLEELLRLYLEYCVYFKEREAKLQITTLEQKLEQMNITMIEMKEEMNLSMEEHADKLDTLVDQNEELKLDVSEANEKLETVTHKLGIAVEDRSPRLEQKPLRERFVLFKRNVKNARFQYYAIRGQSIYVNGRLTLYNERYPNLEIIIDIFCQPNPRNLFLRFKNYVKDDERFNFAGNNVECDITYESIMKEIFEKLNEEKRNV
ncbi:212L [Invertebrate iridescent virus 6]|uniref:Putative MSV199 domain-containing protein 212L n=1 Tax=Invertebrate iridescent virus 6 TaxID=176652 RepID=212L_IIV6|nr:212L [Invertebrate iridescent virus 6]Q91FV9.1 RecName: Full=Putative MSV199 domain-containing protein 212L [Invertebrate iridescent virus 6]AAK82074.1 212L [Invertebrate iridescent virus 6]